MDDTSIINSAAQPHDGIGTRHINPSWVLLCKIWSGSLRRPLTGWFCAKFEANPFNRHGGTEQTSQKLRTTLWPWSWIFRLGKVYEINVWCKSCNIGTSLKALTDEQTHRRIACQTDGPKYLTNHPYPPTPYPESYHSFTIALTRSSCCST